MTLLYHVIAYPFFIYLNDYMNFTLIYLLYTIMLSSLNMIKCSLLISLILQQQRNTRMVEFSFSIKCYNNHVPFLLGIMVMFLIM